MKKFLFLLLLVINVCTFSYYVPVKGYTRSDGTYVAPHYRTRPDGYEFNNLSNSSRCW